jgi:hypothetical protein
MRLGTCLLFEGRTLQGAHPKLAYFCSATVAGFYAAVDIRYYAEKILRVNTTNSRGDYHSPNLTIRGYSWRGLYAFKELA